jgi:hypothetical protein
MKRLKKLNDRFRIRSPFFRFVFIVLGVAFGFIFYYFKNVIEQALPILGENSALSFVARGIGAGLAGLVLFLLLYVLEGAFMPRPNGPKPNSPESDKKVGRSKRRALR